VNVHLPLQLTGRGRLHVVGKLLVALLIFAVLGNVEEFFGT